MLDPAAFVPIDSPSARVPRLCAVGRGQFCVGVFPGSAYPFDTPADSRIRDHPGSERACLAESLFAGSFCCQGLPSPGGFRRSGLRAEGLRRAQYRPAWYLGQ